MPKHNQTKSLGSLTDFQSAIPHTPEPTDERLDRLERRLIQVETLLNDVMQQLDRPFRDLHSKQNGKPSQAKPKPKPVKPSSPKQAKQKPPTVQPTPSHTKADIQAVTEFLKQHGDRLWHGNKLRKAIKERCEGISNKRLKSVLETLRKDGKIISFLNNDIALPVFMKYVAMRSKLTVLRRTRPDATCIILQKRGFLTEMVLQSLLMWK